MHRIVYDSAIIWRAMKTVLFHTSLLDISILCKQNLYNERKR